MAMKTLKTWNKLVTLVTLKSHKTLTKWINQGHVFIINIPNLLKKNKKNKGRHTKFMCQYEIQNFWNKKIGNSKKWQSEDHATRRSFQHDQRSRSVQGLCPKTQIFSHSLSINVFKTTNGQDHVQQNQRSRSACSFLSVPTYLPTNKSFNF